MLRVLVVFGLNATLIFSLIIIIIIIIQSLIHFTELQESISKLPLITQHTTALYYNVCVHHHMQNTADAIVYPTEVAVFSRRSRLCYSVASVVVVSLYGMYCG